MKLIGLQTYFHLVPSLCRLNQLHLSFWARVSHVSPPILPILPILPIFDGLMFEASISPLKAVANPSTAHSGSERRLEAFPPSSCVSCLEGTPKIHWFMMFPNDSPIYFCYIYPKEMSYPKMVNIHRNWSQAPAIPARMPLPLAVASLPILWQLEWSEIRTTSFWMSNDINR